MQPEITKQVQQLSVSVDGVLQAATEYRITTPEAYTASADRLRAIKGIQKQIDDAEKAITKPMNDALKAARDLFRAPKAAAEKAEALIKRAITDYQAEQRRQQAEAQRKADEAAERERQRLAKLQEAAATRGDTGKAEAFQERAAQVVAPVVHVEAPKVAGITTREVYKFEVVDAALVPREYMVVDESRIRKVVQALKGDCNIPGVRVYKEDQNRGQCRLSLLEAPPDPRGTRDPSLRRRWDLTERSMNIFSGSLLGIIGLSILVAFGMYGCPQYNVYQQRMAGEAELAQASYSKQVAVQEAQAKLDGSKLLAEAEVERAKGVAQANKIIGDSLTNNEAYLRYLFVNNLETTKDQVIYVPTEAQLPIMEATRNQKTVVAPPSGGGK